MSSDRRYDVLIVGAGPAGLSAARTAARLGFDTIVVERLAAPGDLAHACHALVVPEPDVVLGRPLLGGLFFPQVDLWIPPSLVIAPDATQKCLSPAGYEYQTPFAGHPAVIDKTGVLRLMAEQAVSAGAHMRFGTEVTGLLQKGHTVIGIQTATGTLRANMVIAADGAMGRLSEQVLHYSSRPRTWTHALALNFELEAPAASGENAGEIVTLGRVAALPGHPAQGLGSVVIPASGRAQVTLLRLVDQPNRADVAPGSFYLEQYAQDPRVRDLLAGSRLIRQSAQETPFQEAPTNIAGDGFMAVGDAIAPTGRMGIMPSIYLGRQAAMFAAEALDAGAPSGAHLTHLDRLFRSAILPGLEAEARTTLALLRMTDAELDRLCGVLNALNLPLPLMGHRPRVEWETASWLMQHLPLAEQDWGLLRRALGVEAEVRLLQGETAIQVPCRASAIAN